jgi:hypothetical protein
MTDLPPTLINAATAIYASKVTQDGMGRPADQRRAAMESFTAALQFQKELDATDMEELGR